MALLLVIALLFLTGTMVDAGSNITNCDELLGNNTCKQIICIQSPCNMMCGLTKVYDVCDQICYAIKCDTVQCSASQSCDQICGANKCSSLTCDSKNCSQHCQGKDCGIMTCPKQVNNCAQSSRNGTMICEANQCTQSCSVGDCNMVCHVGVKSCTQVTVGDAAAVECDGDVCQQFCYRGKCSLTCSLSAKTESCEQTCVGEECESMTCDSKNCTQTCGSADCGVMKCLKNVTSCQQSSSNTTMICEADQCTQQCVDGGCNMACPVGVKNCTQVGVEGVAAMECDGDVCQQICSGGKCNMTCLPNSKECHQICHGEKCLIKCDAEKCKLDCPGGRCTVIKSSTTSEPTVKSGARTERRNINLQSIASVAFGLILELLVFM